MCSVLVVVVIALCLSICDPLLVIVQSAHPVSSAFVDVVCGLCLCIFPALFRPLVRTSSRLSLLSASVGQIGVEELSSTRALASCLVPLVAVPVLHLPERSLLCVCTTLRLVFLPSSS